MRRSNAPRNRVFHPHSLLQQAVRDRQAITHHQDQTALRRFAASVRLLAHVPALAESDGAHHPVLGICGDCAMRGLEALLLHIRLRIGFRSALTYQGELRGHLETFTSFKSLYLPNYLGMLRAQRLDKLCSLLTLVFRPGYITAQA